MKEVFILAGQSNMQGGVNMPTPAPTYTNASRIYCYSQPWSSAASQPISTTNPSGGTWALASDPLHSQPGSGVGPGISMADNIITNRGDPNLEIGLVPCAWSSSAMNKEWMRSLHYGTAYGMMIARARAAKAWGAIKALVIYQGEQEASNQYSFQPDIYPNWDTGLYDLICKFRQEMEDQTIKVVVVQLGDDPNLSTFPNWADMQVQQGTIAGISPTVKLVSASGLGNIGDGVHLTAASQITLGQRIAAVL